MAGTNTLDPCKLIKPSPLEETVYQSLVFKYNDSALLQMNLILLTLTIKLCAVFFCKKKKLNTRNSVP